MESSDTHRFFSMAEAYDRMCPLLVPAYDFLQTAALKLLPFSQEDAVTIVDLGAGSGRMLERLLAAYPNVTCYWVDYSPDFQKIAQNRLSEYSARVNYIISPIEDNWESSLNQSPHAVLSMSAIHHLDTEGKRSLYRRCFDLLQSDGVFLNTDEMITIYDDAYRASLHYWIRHFENAKDNLSEEELPYYLKWKHHFDRWIARNVDAIDQPKKAGDDIHESFLEQLEWLREVGFQRVDLFAKYHLWSLIGGYK